MTLQEMLRRRHGSLTAADQCMAVPLQRPRHADSLGYDLIYIDSSSCSGIGSRIAHSCNPNCMAKTMCAAGKISMGIFTTRHVVEGEELTWDHACFTEMEQESRNATCLCGTSACRGSLLYYVNSRSFQEVLSKQHTFLDRTAMLLVSCTESLSTDDEQRLEDYGVRGAVFLSEQAGTSFPMITTTHSSEASVPLQVSRSVLVDDPCGEGLPVPWMKKWASLLIRYIDYEAEMLPNLLMSKHGASTGRATVESSAIHANRMQNLAATLDKAKYFLRKQPDDCQLPPLRMLSDNEVHAYSLCSLMGSGA